MRCQRCRSVMAQTHEELNPQSRQAWYKCHVCGRAQLISEPLSRSALTSTTARQPGPGILALLIGS
jgi:hypothetical protein